MLVHRPNSNNVVPLQQVLEFKPPIGGPRVPFSVSRRVRVMVHPALFWSYFNATNFTCTSEAVDRSSNITCTLP